MWECSTSKQASPAEVELLVASEVGAPQLGGFLQRVSRGDAESSAQSEVALQDRISLNRQRPFLARGAKSCRFRGHG